MAGEDPGAEEEAAANGIDILAAKGSGVVVPSTQAPHPDREPDREPLATVFLPPP